MEAWLWAITPWGSRTSMRRKERDRFRGEGYRWRRVLRYTMERQNAPLRRGCRVKGRGQTWERWSPRRCTVLSFWNSSLGDIPSTSLLILITITVVIIIIITIITAIVNSTHRGIGHRGAVLVLGKVEAQLMLTCCPCEGTWPLWNFRK